ncbi:hypothetical protein TRVL_02383 [Trypanosoma vivax]|uniref:Uncharacterized protein n=1 Tax=Trypanosoma vivax (strain Y486) TaxID=1055687 RepID=G0TVL7_TRYVY|nr:hypothetical protein TRVL_02383 [Trypanosoma vivax]CCC47983.1 hypothetical protein, unlikely [Trypanosoma vivax Y486]
MLLFSFMEMAAVYKPKITHSCHTTRVEIERERERDKSNFKQPSRKLVTFLHVSGKRKRKRMLFFFFFKPSNKMWTVTGTCTKKQREKWGGKQESAAVQLKLLPLKDESVRQQRYFKPVSPRQRRSARCLIVIFTLSSNAAPLNR